MYSRHEIAARCRMMAASHKGRPRTVETLNEAAELLESASTEIRQLREALEKIAYTKGFSVMARDYARETLDSQRSEP